MIQWIKADNPKAQFIFAHGAGADSDSEFMQDMANKLAEHGIQVGLFDFEYMQVAKQTGKRRPPDRAPKLLAYFNKVLASIDTDLPLFIGGKSMGGRMASLLVTEHSLPVKGVIAMGYPFHPPGKPEKLRTEHFADIPCPFLVLQGERDTFGTQAELAEMSFAKAPTFQFFADGDHSLKPRKKSGFSEEAHRLAATKTTVEFIEQHLND